MRHSGIALAAVAAMLLAACTNLPYAPVKYSNGLMTGPNGMTLYTDQPGGDWSIVTRDDGSKQWAWSGQPLYYWAKDQKPGDMTGDGFNKVWHAVRPPPPNMTGNMNC